MRQPRFKNTKFKRFQKNYPNADDVMKNGFLIACHQGLSKKMIDHLHSSVEKFMLSKQIS